MGGLLSACLRAATGDSDSGTEYSDVGPIRVPRWEAGAVIGQHGSTIRRIQQESGAHVDVTNQGNTAVISFSGSPDQIQKARTLVQGVLDGAEHVDYTGNEGQKLRDEAQKLWQEKTRLGKEAHNAYERGDGQKAHGLKQKKEEVEKRAKAKDQQAAETIFRHRNKGKGDLFIDLHGLHVDEALDYVEQRLQKVRNSKRGQVLEVVTGAGHHSSDHKAHIKPKVIKILRQANLKFEEKNAGSINVFL